MGVTDHVILEGDPDKDSTRRHLERVLKNTTSQQRTIGVALAAGGTAWGLWRLVRLLRGRRAGEVQVRAGNDDLGRRR